MTQTPQITVYSATWCAFCHAVDSDRSIAEEAMKVSGQTGIPVLDINGQIIIGFDRPKIDAALATT
jgi:glutaredoxin 3